MNKKIKGAGIGLRQPHFKEIIENTPKINWLEIHTENFFAEGGATLQILREVAKNYPLSFHGVGLSLGSSDGLSQTHLKKTKALIDEFQPELVSEHISWSAIGGVFMNDLLPVPYTKESLQTLCDNISKTQEFLGREILVENPSSYLEFKNSDMHEYDFMREVALKSGCFILLDINNIFVTHKNHGVNINNYLNAIPKEKVKEIHLAGHANVEIDNQPMLIDDHGSDIIDAVWKIYEQAISIFGKIPTLIERDNNIPDLAILIEQADKADKIMCLKQ